MRGIGVIVSVLLILSGCGADEIQKHAESLKEERAEDDHQRIAQDNFQGEKIEDGYEGCGSTTWSTAEFVYADNPDKPLPKKLSSFGLYPDILNLNQLHPRAIYYEPQYPLWTNGSIKRRALVLPQDQQIQIEAGAWRYPEGSMFFKTFSYYKRNGGERPIETRVLRGRKGGWEFAVYRWDYTGKEAYLADIRSSGKARIVDMDGSRFEHEIPSLNDCLQCHQANGNFVIGFSELQLNSPAPDTKRSQIDVFCEMGVIKQKPKRPETIEIEDEFTRRVVGYVQGNCVHCHNGRERVDFRHSVFLKNVIEQENEGLAMKAGFRVLPGFPNESILYLAMSSKGDVPDILPMPPIGVQKKDQEAIGWIYDWIKNMAP